MCPTAGERDCTEEGIQFLMLDTYHQLWLLLKQYTEAAAKRSGDSSNSVAPANFWPTGFSWGSRSCYMAIPCTSLCSVESAIFVQICGLLFSGNAPLLSQGGSCHHHLWSDSCAYEARYELKWYFLPHVYKRTKENNAQA